MTKEEQITEASKSLKRNKPREIVELSEFYMPHTRQHELPGRIIEELAKKRIRNKFSSYPINPVGVRKYDYPMETMPNVLTVHKVIEILKDLNERMDLLEKATASIGTRSIKVMEEMLSRIGKNESKLEELARELEV